MSFGLIERLESMSGYRHVFSPHDVNSALNPVNHSHVTMRFSGKELHIISRVGDAGHDYSGRSNKLAHLIVLDESDLSAAGPARLMCESGVINDGWDGTTRRVANRTLSEPQIPPTVRLSTWKAVCGDNGWAGKVAEQLLEASTPVSIIFNAGTDTLSLTREVLDLIPLQLRWSITFSTYFTRLLPGSNCQLRFVLNDTSDATVLRNDARSRVVDLAIELPEANGGRLVTLARQREFVVPLREETVAKEGLFNAAEDSVKLSVASSDSGERSGTIATPTTQSQSDGSGNASLLVNANLTESESNSSDRRFIFAISTVVAMLFIVGAIVAVSPFLLQDKSSDKFDQIVARSSITQSNMQIPANSVLDSVGEVDSGAGVSNVLPSVPAVDSKKVDAARAAVELEAARAAKEKVAEELKAAKLARRLEWQSLGPFVLIRNDASFQDNHAQWLFDLPRPNDTSEPRPLPLSLAGRDVELSLFDGAASLFENSSYQLELVATSENPDEWTAIAIAGTSEIQLARYSVERIPDDRVAERSADCLIHFQWLTEAARETEAAELLRWWPLQIRVGDRAAVLLQRVAEYPHRLPTWSALLTGEPFLFPKTDALKALQLEKTPGIEFSLEVIQGKNKPQILQLQVAQEANPQGSLDSSRKQVASLKRYFNLEPTIKFFEERPEVNSKLLGFGEVELQLGFVDESLALTPSVDVAVRLPKKEFLANLPSEEVRGWLNEVIQTPALLSQFVPEQLEQRLVQLGHSRESLSSDPVNWHSQRIKKLPPRRSFATDHFSDLTRRAVKSVRGTIPALRAAATKAKANRDALYVRDFSGNTMADRLIGMGENATVLATEQAADATQRELNFAITQYAPRIEPFEAAMKTMNDRVTEAIEDLLKDYESIEMHVDSIIQSERQFIVRSSLLTTIPIADAENGPTVRLYLFESPPSFLGK